MRIKYYAVYVDLVEQKFISISHANEGFAEMQLGEETFSKYLKIIQRDGGYKLLWPEKVKDASVAVCPKIVHAIIISGVDGEDSPLNDLVCDFFLEHLNDYYLARLV
jgi:hypothetical protein